MRSPVLLGIATVAIAIAIGLAGSALALQGPAWIGALLIGMLLVSLVDPQRFYSADPRPRPRRR